MKINISKSNNVYNNNSNNVSIKKDTKDSVVEKNNAPKKVAFYGLYKKNPIDATKVFRTINMQPQEEYIVSPMAEFKLGEKYISLGNEEIVTIIDNLEPNQNLYIDNKDANSSNYNNTADSFLCIRKDASGKIVASSYGKNSGAQIQPNVITPTNLERSFRLNPSMYYEFPLDVELGLGGHVSINLADYKDKITALKNGEKLIVGRLGTSDIKIENPTVSRSHLSIEKYNDKVLIKDLNSFNGTSFEKYNPPFESKIYTLKKGVETKVSRESQLYLGGDFAIDLRNKNITDLLKQQKEVFIGRSSNSDIVVPQFYDLVSNNHLKLAMKNGAIFVTDLNSTNSTKVIPKSEIRPFYQGVENIEFSQGNIGDCFLLANLYALSRNPNGQKLIENMVRIDDEGNYIVTFPDKNPIVVPLEQLDGQKVGNEEKLCVRGELGIRAIERAYGKLLDNFQNPGRTLLMAIDKGDLISKTLENLTGKVCKNFYVPYLNVNDKFNELAQKTMSDYVMLCSTHNKGDYSGYVDPEKKFIEGHAYAIKSFDADKKLVEIINPHNTKQPKFVTFEQFGKYFDYMHVLEF